MIGERHRFYVVGMLAGAGASLILCAATEQSGLSGASRAIVPSTKKVRTSAGAVPRPTSSELRGHVEHDELVEDSWQQLYDRGEQLYRSGQYQDAYKQWRESLKAAEELKVWTKASGPQRIEILKKLAMMYKTQSQPGQAIEMYNLAILDAVRIYGKESAQVAALMLEQGRMYTFYEQIKSVSKANEFMNEAFRINEKLYGRYTIPTGDVAIAIAQLKESEQRFSEALSYWQLAIDIGDKLEPNIISCCRIGPRQGKARCLEQIGQSQDAIMAHKDLVAMCRAGARDMMPTVLNSYASCLAKFGHATEASAVSAEAESFKR